MNVPYPLPTRKPYSADRVRELFNAAGMSICTWAETNGYTRHAVYCVMGGRSKSTRGQGHEIAVKLGLKLAVEQLVA